MGFNNDGYSRWRWLAPRWVKRRGDNLRVKWIQKEKLSRLLEEANCSHYTNIDDIDKLDLPKLKVVFAENPFEIFVLHYSINAFINLFINALHVHMWDYCTLLFLFWNCTLFIRFTYSIHGRNIASNISQAK